MRVFLLVILGAVSLLYAEAVVKDQVGKHLPVVDRSVRRSDLRRVMPEMLPAGAQTLVGLQVSDVRCTPRSPATATQVVRVPHAEEQVELALRRQMAALRWRDLPRRPHVGAASVTMRYERGIGEEQVGTMSYVLTGDGPSTTVHLSLVGSIRGRCGVR